MPNKQFILPVASSSGSGGSVTSSTVTNLSNVTGATVTAALNTLITGGAGDFTGLVSTSVTITPTQMKALVNTGTPASALVALPAPGAGKMISVERLEANLQFATTPYATGTGGLGIYYLTSAPAIGSTVISGLLSNVQIASSISTATATNNIGLNAVPVTTTVNCSIAFALTAGSSFTAGDSPIVVTFYYRTYSVS